MRYVGARAGGWVGGCVSMEDMQITAAKLWATVEVWSQEHHPNIQVSRWLTYFVDIVDITM